MTRNMALASLNVIILIACAFVEYAYSVQKIESSLWKDELVREAIERRSDSLAHHLVNILVEEKRERENLRKDNRLMKKKLEDVLRELHERNKVLGDEKFQRKKLIEEVKTTKVELKKELKKELRKQLANFNDTLSTLKTESGKMGAKTEAIARVAKDVKNDLVGLKDKVKTRDNASSKQGAVYIRWGRSSCPPNTTDLIYSGRLGGSYYAKTGGPSNYQCLPDDPDWRKYKSGTQGSPIYGGAYQNLGSYSEGELLEKKYNRYVVVCAVCQSRSRKVVYMVPGKSHCHSGWHREYRGYLMSGHYTHSASNYICIDAKPDTIPGSNGSNAGELLYTVEAGCTRMKCPPYVSGRELTCAVCTR